MLGRHLAGVEIEDVEADSEESIASADLDSARDANLDSAGAPRPEPEADPAPAPPPQRVLPGRVAYLRCEGARPTQGPYPCPRDRDLERVVWAALGALAECPGRPVAGGEGDLRLSFGGGVLEERALRGRGEGGLPEAAVLGCLEEPLGALTTTIRAEELVVSFRFVLARR
ncbi:MAG: hypothetical protein DRJ42_13865 [Deltaproteobacteria bacterium]|nr:MAG: hypothetical protein DRJ42_13865 [Deltaproteobacteria bacterium]